MTLLSSLAVPRDRLALVFLNATAGREQPAELGLRGSEALLGCLAIPRDRLAVALLNATALIVHKAEIELRGGLALLGEPAETCRLFAPATTWNGWRGLFTKFFGSTRP